MHVLGKKCSQHCVFLLVLIFFHFEWTQNLFSQTNNHQKRPKLGLVLSGGGAKGFAHIGALKVFEDAGLQFDYIGGTSMGSIMGALYSLGYSPDSIENIVRQQDWARLMSDRIPRSFIPIEEKRSSDRLLVTFPIKNKRVLLKQGVNNGQLIDLLLSKYTSSAYHITDFNKLPIPFVCIGTDLSNGNNVVLRQGSLSRAIRASMSIPSYFTPVSIDGRLLVDGGVVNNYPVKEVLDMGADLIVGVDVQTGLYPVESLNSIFKILDQVTSFYRMAANEKGKELTDLYLYPDLSGYDMMSFSDYDTIIKRGEMAARAVLPKLQKLADSLDRLGPRKEVLAYGRPLDSIFVAVIQYNGLKKVSRSFLDGSLKIKPRSWVKIDDLEQGILHARGSGFFESIHYSLIPEKEGAVLVFEITEAGSGVLGAGIHYDSDYKVSLLLNATFKNVAVRGSKIFVDLSLGENPHLQALYLVDRGAKTGFGLRASFFNLTVNEYQDGKVIDINKISQNSLESFAQWTLHDTYRWKAGFLYEYIKIATEFGDQSFNVFSPILTPFINFSADDFDRTSYSTTGQQIDFTIKYVMPLSNKGISNLFDNALILSYIHQRNIRINSQHTLKTGFLAGFTIKETLPPPQHYFILGGQSRNNYFDTFIPFTGMRFIEQTGLYALLANLGWQYNVYKNFYLTAKCDLGFFTNTWEEMLDGSKLLTGYGIAVGYDSFIGPVELSLMKSNSNKSMIGFVNIGYWF